jgi:hypothetical protein
MQPKAVRTCIWTCLILLAGTVRAGDPQITGLVEQVSIDNISSHIDSLCYAGGHYSRITYTAGNYAAAGYIASYFESLPGITHVQRDTFYLKLTAPPYDNYPLINISATLESRSGDPGVYIVGAHYDDSASRQPNYSTLWDSREAQGADDNATGVAAVMEIARILSDPQINFRNRYTIRFIAFAAEESHPKQSGYSHLGSQYDALRAKQGQIPLAGVLVLDMIGYNTLTDYVEVISNTASTWLADSAVSCSAEYTPGLIVNKPPFPDVPYSDHQSYQDQGYPAILMMENDSPWNDQLPLYSANPNYHTTSDLPNTLNYSQTEMVTKTALSTLASLTIDKLAGGVSAGPMIPSDVWLQVYPNPFNARIRIVFNIGHPGFIEAKIYDLNGRIIHNVCRGKVTAGTYSYVWETNRASGIYILRLSGEGINLTKKLICLK